MTRMLDAGTKSLRAQPIATVMFGATLTVVLLVALGWGAWAAYASQRSAQETAYRSQFLLSRVALLNEVATRSARMAAVTGDLAWREQYREVEPALDTAIQGLVRVADDEDEAKAARRIGTANREMIRIEHAAFERVQQGQGSAALSLLSSDEYNRQKAVFGTSIQDISNAVQASRQTYERVAQRRLLMGGLLIALGALVLFAIWAIVFFRLRRYLAERDRAEAQVRASEAKFRQVVENIQEVFWITDPAERRFVYLSPAWEAIWGRSVESVYENPAVFVESIHPEDREQIASALASAASDGYSQTYRIVRPDGAIRWIRARGFWVPETSEGGARMVGVAEDVTGQKKAEEAHRASEERLRALIDSSPLPIQALDADGNVTLWNPAAERTLGWARNEVLGRPNPLVPEEKQEEFRALLDRVLRGESLTGVEIRRKRKDGTPIDLRLSTAPLYGAHGVVMGVMAVLEDTTLLKKAEEQLEAQRAFLRAVIDSSPSGVFVKDAEGRFTLANPVMGGLYGLTPQEMVGKTDAELGIPSERVEEFKRMDRQVIQTGELRFFPAEPFTSPRTGETRWLETRKVPLRIPGDGPQVLGITTDVTELKEAEERQRQLIREKTARQETEAAQQRIRRILESITDAFFSLDEKWCFTYVNGEAEALLDRSREELVGRNIWELYPESAERAFHAQYHRAVGEQVAVEFEEYSPRPNRWLRVRAYPYEEGLTVYLRDITDRIAAEEALRESERQHRLLFQGNPVPMWVYDPETLRFLDVNEAAVRHYRYSREEFLSITIRDIRAEEDLPELEQVLRRGLEEGQTDTVRHRTKDGRDIHVLVTGSTIPFRDKPARLVVAHDVTERVRVEEALHESQLTMQSVLAASPDIVEMLDAEGRFRWVSPAIREALGYEAEEVQGRPIRDFLVRDDGEAFESSLRLLVDGGSEEVRLRYSAVHRDGHEVPMEARGRAVRNEVLHGLVLVARDVTEQEQLVQSLHAAKEAAEAANRAKSEMLSRTSHELRTPLNAILGFGQILEMDVEREEDRESVEQILRAGRHLLSLIDKVLDIARAESGHMELPSEPVHVGDAVEEAFSLLRPLAQQSKVELPGSPLGACDARVLADPQRLKQVLLNLVSNAIKYNREEGRVEVTCEGAQGERVRIRVCDTGPGIPPERLSRLFRPFDRLDAEKSSASMVEGTGLGLALSKALTEAMGGEIGAESVQGEGSTFWIELPRAPGNPEMLSESTSGAEGSGSLAAEVAISAPVVLCVEDNVANLRLIERILRRARPEVELVTAADGRLGLELARERRPDLILLDLNLPDLSGEEVLVALGEAASTREIPVVMISGDVSPEQIEKVRELGAVDYLTKPFAVPRFLEVIATRLREPGAE